MSTKTAAILVLCVTVAAMAGSAILYPSLPERVPTHWNLRGDPDRWSGKLFGAVILPGLVALPLLFILIGDWLSPERFKISAFRWSFNYLMVILAALLAYLHAVTLTAALHPERAYGRWIAGGIFLFLAWVGNLLGKTRRNFWIGVRTPWALASDAVWIGTHRLAARVFMAVGILGALAAALGVSPVWCFAGLMAGVMIPVFYSFWLSKKLEKQGA